MNESSFAPVSLMVTWTFEWYSGGRNYVDTYILLCAVVSAAHKMAQWIHSLEDQVRKIRKDPSFVVWDGGSCQVGLSQVRLPPAQWWIPASSSEVINLHFLMC